MSFIENYLGNVVTIAQSVNTNQIQAAIDLLAGLRNGDGRLFILGVGGSAANCSHAVNDFRKLAGIEAYAPTDNVSELSARTNDEGWATVFSEWLKVSRLGKDDVVMILSVGGGDEERNVSPNLVAAINLAKTRGSKIIGIVGRNGGYTAQKADVTILIPTITPDLVTPLAESWQGVIWHLIVSHPSIAVKATKWESMVLPHSGAADDGSLSAKGKGNDLPL